MWIETVFRDWQSGGFQLDQCGLSDTTRLVRELFVLAIGYLWLVSLGRWVVKRGYRLLIDDGSSHHWHFSLFELIIRVIEEASSQTMLPDRYTGRAVSRADPVSAVVCGSKV